MTVRVKCVHCGTMVHEFTATCPNCGKPVANKDAPVDVSPPPWKKKNESYGKKIPILPIAVVIIAIVAVALYFFMK